MWRKRNTDPFNFSNYSVVFNISNKHLWSFSLRKANWNARGLCILICKGDKSKQIKLILLHLIEKARPQITLASSSRKINKHRGALPIFPTFLQFGLCELYWLKFIRSLADSINGSIMYVLYDKFKVVYGDSLSSLSSHLFKYHAAKKKWKFKPCFVLNFHFF